ncbi:MAG: acyltransferase [bacterium]
MAKGAGLKLFFLHAACNYNRARLYLLRHWLGERANISPSADVWAGCLRMKGEGRVEIGPDCAIERGPFPFYLELDKGSLAGIGRGTWVRGKYRPNVITCFENARVEVGEGSLLNGAIISARELVSIGRKAVISWNTTIIDSDLHRLDSQREVRTAPVRIKDFVMIGAGATVLPGVSIGSHSVIGAGSLVRSDIPDHAVAAGNPAVVVGEVGDRDECL